LDLAQEAQRDVPLRPRRPPHPRAFGPREPGNRVQHRLVRSYRHEQPHATESGTGDSPRPPPTAGRDWHARPALRHSLAVAESDDLPKPNPSSPGGAVARLRAALATPRGKVIAAIVALVV